MFYELTREIRKFNSDRNWDGDHTPKNLAMSIVIEAAELSECFQWLNQEDVPNKKAVEEEVADVMIYLINLCDKLDIDMYESIKLKLKKNATRFAVA